jgi:hypothetical protein
VAHRLFLRLAVPVLGLSSAAFAALAAVSCQDRPVHLFGGYPYDPVGNCLDPAEVIDVVAGADGGTCPVVRCWEDSCGGIFVTDTSCDDPPGYTDLTDAASGPCVKALAAYAEAGHDFCQVITDGGDVDGGLGCGLGADPGAGVEGVP